MPAELHPQSLPNDVEYVIAWLRGLDDPCDWNRPSGDVLPYRMVNGPIPGEPDINLLTGESVVTVHTFGPTYEAASDAADVTDRRMNVLVRDPSRDVMLLSGVIVNADYVEPLQPKPYRIDFDDPTIQRFVTRYRIGFGSVNVAA